uniref:Alpha-N-acetylgalactosaminide alpha-2,6-sialyltransferase 1 n=2 Tax=Sphaerodactylus townsendi TaxID=933632 RepID=A0ACB8EKU1_9SAUR
MNVQQSTQGALPIYQEKVKPLLSSYITAQEQDAVKRLVLNHNLDVKKEHTKEREETSAVIEKQTRNSFVVPAANKKQAEKELRRRANEMQPESTAVTPTAKQNLTVGKGAKQTANQKQGKRIALVPVSKKQKNKDVMPHHKQEKQTKEKLKERDLSEEHLVTSDPPSRKLFTKAKSVSVTADHSVLARNHSQRFKASDFRSEPRWDFDDQYLLDNSTPQSTCPNSLRVKAANSDWLQGIFLPNITLFMDRSHFSDSEWERMEHFPPPFGFMELNYSLVKEVITMLPPKPYHQILMAQNSSHASRCITCAVVGNGGILNNSRMGQEIDSHHYVFRVSGAVIKGYEKDVGTRTSFYGFTAYSLMSSLMILGHQGFKKIPMGKEIKYLHFLEGERDYEWLKALLLNKEVRKGFLDYYGKIPRDKFDNNFSLDKYFVIHPDFLRYTKNRFLKSKNLDKPYWRIYRPSTGAFLLLTALHLCDQVSAYGYLTEGHQKYSDHYYDKEWKRFIFYSNHDFDLERRVWKKLHDADIMTLYQKNLMENTAET